MAGALLTAGFWAPGQVLAAHKSEPAADGVQHEESKEFQLKIDAARAGSAAAPADDFALLAAACRALDECLGGGSALAEAAPVVREAIRYDTSDRPEDALFRRQGLSLAIEATDARTKLKCKHHSFIPELLGAEPADSVCYPSLRGGRAKARFKIEQDLHFNNTKTCASGSVFLPGRRTDADAVSFFSAHFPGIASLCAPETRLHVVHHWRETVFEVRELRFGKARFANLMLVNRRDPSSGALVESELSYKVRREAGRGWDREQLALASRLYAALNATRVFQADPPIFYLLDPVGSVDILKA